MAMGKTIEIYRDTKNVDWDIFNSSGKQNLVKQNKMTATEHKLLHSVLRLEEIINNSDLDDDLQPELTLLRLETKQLLEKILETIAINEQRRIEEENSNV